MYHNFVLNNILFVEIKCKWWFFLFTQKSDIFNWTWKYKFEILGLAVFKLKKVSRYLYFRAVIASIYWS